MPGGGVVGVGVGEKSSRHGRGRIEIEIERPAIHAFGTKLEERAQPVSHERVKRLTPAPCPYRANLLRRGLRKEPEERQRHYGVKPRRARDDKRNRVDDASDSRPVAVETP